MQSVFDLLFFVVKMAAKLIIYIPILHIDLLS